MKTIGIVIAVIVAVGISIGGYFWLSQEKPQKYTGPVEKITLAASGDEGALVLIAEEQGYFTNNGLDVTIKEYEAGKLAADALLAGEADICTSADFVLTSNSFDHEDLRVFGTVSIINSNELVARKDHGIETILDLKGKRIGVTRKSVGEFFLGTFLTFNDLLLEDVELVDLKPSEIVEAISSGNIDAGLTWQPNVYNIKKRLGQIAVSWPGQSGQDFFFILISKEDWLRKHPSAAERFLRALVQAEKYVKSNDAESRRFIEDHFQYESKYIESIWPRYQFIVLLPQALLPVFEDQARWRLENNLNIAKEVPNYLDYIYLQALEEVKPEAVGIIH